MVDDSAHQEFDLDAFIDRMSGGRTSASARDDGTVGSPEALLDEVVARYLTSGDFNGLVIGPSQSEHHYAESLIRDGMLQLVTEHEAPNFHIRPWADPRVDQQVARLGEVLAGECSGCLYPTPQAMSTRDLSAYGERPYTRAQAAGNGTLELRFFGMAAIEDFRNDPRYHYDYADFGVTFGIGDDAYTSEDEPDADKIHTVRAGFAYDQSVTSKDSPTVHRYLCAFLTDLGKLTAIHQARLATWERPSEDLHPHPVWYKQQMGEWPEYMGPFEKILEEMKALNEVWGLTYGETLFKNTDRHRNWGWVLRPSTVEWDAFILLTDQLLSENMRKSALDAANAPTMNQRNQPVGSLGRLREFLRDRKVSDEQADEVMGPFFRVRKERQKPAHAAGTPLSDNTLVARQRDLLNEIGVSLWQLRAFIARHPKVVASGWQASDHLEKWMAL